MKERAAGNASLVECQGKEEKGKKIEPKSKVGNSLVSTGTWSAGPEVAVLMQGHRNASF